MIGVWSALGALIGATAALLVVALHRIVAQKRAAIDVLLNIRTDSDLLDSRRTLVAYAGKGQLSRILDPQTDADNQAKLQIQNYLNALELVCVSIKRHVIDEDVCLDLIRDTITRTWLLVEHTIQTIRDSQDNQSYYTELQFVATKWLANEKCSKDPKVISTIKELWPFRRTH